MKIFSQGLSHLPEDLPYRDQFSEEIVKNVFNEKRRYELLIDEETFMKRSDRGCSIDETPEYA